MKLKQSKNYIKVIDEVNYLPETDTGVYWDDIKRSDCVVVDILSGINHNGEVINIKYEVNDHSANTDHTIIEVDKDGLYRVGHYLIGTEEWVIRYQLENGESDALLYYKDEKFYKTVPGSDYTQAEIVDVDVILETESVLEDENFIFITYYIKRCFNEMVKKILSASANCDNKNIRLLKEQRDLVFSFINIIQYLIEFNDLLEAQLTIEKFFKCNTMCNQKLSNITNYDCGCK